MLNRLASLAIQQAISKALPGKLDFKRHSPSILYLQSLCVSATKALARQGQFYELAHLSKTITFFNDFRLVSGWQGIRAKPV